MFTRSVIGFDPPEQEMLNPFANWGESMPVGSELWPNGVYTPTSEALPPAPTVATGETPFNWGSVWEGAKEVLTTGASIFGQVYPAIKGRPASVPGLQVPINPATGQPYQVNPLTGQIIVPGSQLAGATPAWLWPVVAGVGGFLLINMLSGKRR